MLARSDNLSLVLAACCFPLAGIANCQEIEALFLPEDEQFIDDMTRAGTRESPALAGLSRMTFRDSDTIYYVVDQVAAAYSRVADGLADVWRNDSDISIQFSVRGPEIVHLNLTADGSEVQYFRFERWLRTELSEYFDAGGFASGSASVEYLAYVIPVDRCAGLGTNVTGMRTALQESVNGIGSRRELQEILVDGASYALRVRMNGIVTGRFSVGANAGALFDSARSIMQSVRECSDTVEPEVRTVEF